MRSLLRGIASNRRKLIAAAALILVLAAFLRLYNIQWSFSDNGIDEGIMLERSLMVGRGYSLYTDIPCDQAPLAFYIGGLFDGSLLGLRLVVALLSIAAIGACMLAAKRIKGNIAMLATGLLLTVDFAFLRESRLFSLDMLAAAFAAFAILPFVSYLKSGSRLYLAPAGVMLGLSMASKLLGVLPLLGLVLFMVLERRTEQMKGRWLPDIAQLVAFSAIPLAAFLVLLGPEEMIRGMVLDQGHRGFDLGLKLSILGYFGLNLAYILPFTRLGRLWKSGPAPRALLSVTAVTLAFMVLQPLTFFHHLVLMSPGLAILAGVVMEDILSERACATHSKTEGSCARTSRGAAPFVAALLIGVLASGGLAAYGLAAQGENSQYTYAEMIAGHSDANDFVIAGDPTIAALADRMAPPTAINLAYRVYPDVTLDTLEAAMNDNVTVVVICYRLNEIQGLEDYLYSVGFNHTLPPRIFAEKPVLSLFEDGIGQVSFFYRAHPS